MVTPSPIPTTPLGVVHSLLDPSNGNGTISDEIACYGLPYGALGIISHTFTYYTGVCVIFGWAPIKWWENQFTLRSSRWVKLQYDAWNTANSVISLITTVITAAITMRTCKKSWPLVLMACWKLLLGLSISLATLIRARYTWPGEAKRMSRRNPKSHVISVPEDAAQPSPESVPLRETPQLSKAHSPHVVELYHDVLSSMEEAGPQDERDHWLWQLIRKYVVRKITKFVQKRIKPQFERLEHVINELVRAFITSLGALPYLIGIPIGATGIIAIVHETISMNRNVAIVTGATAGAGLLFEVLAIGLGCLLSSQPLGGTIMLISYIAGIFIPLLALVFYTDLVIAAVRNDWIGVPTGSPAAVQVAYWFYFAAKRLPMLSA